MTEKIVNRNVFSGDNMFDEVGKPRIVDYDLFPYQKDLLVVNEHIEAMRKFSEIYAKRTNTFFCESPDVTSMVIIGLGSHKDIYGAPLCPCRNYDDKEAEVENAYWNCPCVPMRERKECHCMLFLTPENEFATQLQEIGPEHFEITVDIDTYIWNGDDRVFLT